MEEELAIAIAAAIDATKPDGAVKVRSFFVRDNAIVGLYVRYQMRSFFVEVREER